MRQELVLIELRCSWVMVGVEKKQSSMKRKRCCRGSIVFLMSHHYRVGRLATEDDDLARISSNPYNVPNIRGLI